MKPILVDIILKAGAQRNHCIEEHVCSLHNFSENSRRKLCLWTFSIRN